jgi:hypothetical protein
MSTPKQNCIKATLTGLFILLSGIMISAESFATDTLTNLGRIIIIDPTGKVSAIQKNYNDGYVTIKPSLTYDKVLLTDSKGGIVAGAGLSDDDILNTADTYNKGLTSDDNGGGGLGGAFNTLDSDDNGGGGLGGAFLTLDSDDNGGGGLGGAFNTIDSDDNGGGGLGGAFLTIDQLNKKIVDHLFKNKIKPSFRGGLVFFE